MRGGCSSNGEGSINLVHSTINIKTLAVYLKGKKICPQHLKEPVERVRIFQF